MDIRKLQRAIVDGLEDVKAQDIQVFNTEHLSPLFERVVVASGTSNRQTKALAASVRDAVKSRGMAVMRTEGEDNGEWIIVDCGAAVVHIMQPAIRQYYHLEEIWGGKPVRIKIGAQTRSLPKASESMDADEGDEDDVPAPPVKAAAKAGAKPAAKKPAAKKVAAKKVAAKKVAAKKPAAKKAGASKAPAKKAAAKQPATKKATAKKPAAKAPARKSASASAGKRSGRAGTGGAPARKSAA